MSDPQLSPEHIRLLIEHDAGRAWGRYGDYRITSHFQPILSLAHCRVVGHEGLLRAYRDDGGAIPPPVLLEEAERKGDLVHVDRLAQLLHAVNRGPGEPGRWLFLNMHPEAFIQARADAAGPFMASMLAREGLAPRQVVIEVLEQSIRDQMRFADTVLYLREQGFLIALDDFGAGHSNFDRVWEIKPEIVKLDRNFALRMESDPTVRRLMPGIVSLLHEAGSLVLLEGIETAEQARIALDSDIDFVQGYHFARPAPATDGDSTALQPVVDLWDDFSSREHAGLQEHRERIAPYQNAIGYASVLLSAGRTLEDACQGFLELPRAEMCYLLDREGRQVGANVIAPHASGRGDPRFAPIAGAPQARWSRRPYFRRAVGQFGKVQVTRPYLSSASAHMCRTLSISFHHNDALFVLCGDISGD